MWWAVYTQINRTVDTVTITDCLQHTAPHGPALERDPLPGGNDIYVSPPVRQDWVQAGLAPAVPSVGLSGGRSDEVRYQRQTPGQGQWVLVISRSWQRVSLLITVRVIERRGYWVQYYLYIGSSPLGSSHITRSWLTEYSSCTQRDAFVSKELHNRIVLGQLLSLIDTRYCMTQQVNVLELNRLKFVTIQWENFCL